MKMLTEDEKVKLRKYSVKEKKKNGSKAKVAAGQVSPH